MQFSTSGRRVAAVAALLATVTLAAVSCSSAHDSPARVRERNARRRTAVDALREVRVQSGHRRELRQERVREERWIDRAFFEGLERSAQQQANVVLSVGP